MTYCSICNRKVMARDTFNLQSSLVLPDPDQEEEDVEIFILLICPECHQAIASTIDAGTLKLFLGTHEKEKTEPAEWDS